jgi:type I restriction enzyme R subunit
LEQAHAVSRRGWFYGRQNHCARETSHPGTAKRADYILYYKPNIPVAVIEAKDNKHTLRAGLQQGLDYAQTLDLPFVFSSNGDGFAFHDKTSANEEIERELTLDEFPSPKSFGKSTKHIKALQRPILKR